jgi:hypothetical protein
MAQMAQIAQMETAKAQIADLNASAQEKSARAQKAMVEAQLAPEEVKAKTVAAISTNLQAGNSDDKEFERRAKIAELMLKEKDINLKKQDMEQNKEIVMQQMAGKKENMNG